MIRDEVTTQAIPNEGMKPQVDTKPPFRAKIVWVNAMLFVVFHLLLVYSLYLIMSGQIHWKTLLFAAVIAYSSSTGLSIGAHRLFSHRSFTASTGLKIFLLAMQTMAGQNCMYIWARDHRQHHMFSDTDADPHNSKRGLWFSYVGWLMVRKHPDVIAKGKSVNMSDLDADPYTMFQKRYYNSLYFIMALFLPVIVPCLMWEETLWNSFLVTYVYRSLVVLHITWTVNSVAHILGNKPYNKYIIASDNLFLAFITSGEGYHNYHHQFPWDYRTSEIGMKYNWSTIFIDYFAKLGLATNLRTTSDEIVRKTIERQGDGSHHLWGFGDSNMNTELHKVLERNAPNGKRGSIGCKLNKGTKTL